MSKQRYIALLRGINVGGNNIIKMTALKSCFEGIGYSDVKTYIASGNVLFLAAVTKKAELEKTIEETLSKAFSYRSTVVVLSAQELERAIQEAPHFGEEPEKYRYDVLFVKEPETATNALSQLTLKEGVDAAHAGAHALYFRRLISKISQSHLTKINQKSIYQSITVRNWNTTTTLHSLASE